MASVRARVTGSAVVLVFVVLAAASAVVVLLQWRQLLAATDRSLTLAAEELLLQLETEGDAAAVLAGAADPLNPDDHFAAVQRGGEGAGPAGRVESATPNLAASVGGTGVVDLSVAADGSPFRTRSDIPIDDDAYRLVVRDLDGVATGSDGPAVLVVGENIDDQLDGVRSLATILAILVPAVTAAFGLAAWWLVGRTLSPVERIRQQVEGIGPRQLDHRVPVPATDDEIARLAVTMNSMLDRVGRASMRQERFVGDASHELRQPLTRMRSSLEVDLAGNGDLRPAAETALRETVAMQALVDDLLLLARLDHERPPELAELVDLDVVVDEEVERVRGREPIVMGRTGGAQGSISSPGLGEPTRIDMSSVSGAVVAGRREQLARVVRNLLNNAVAHARSAVAVSLTDDGESVMLAVDDDGPGVPLDARDTVFDRFARLDEARRSDGGTGLGLAIVRELVRGHGGTVRCGDSALGGARFEVVLPAAR